jgi:hypothetical protein
MNLSRGYQYSEIHEQPHRVNSSTAYSTVRLGNRTFACPRPAESVKWRREHLIWPYIQGDGVIQSIRKVHERRLTD